MRWFQQEKFKADAFLEVMELGPPLTRTPGAPMAGAPAVMTPHNGTSPKSW